ncbi:MAG: hypothetical protein JJU33_06170 [Phycisphaerales bacterium]|nr:hypothetical protein [Phycisphaerales bacterium]
MFEDPLRTAKFVAVTVLGVTVVCLIAYANWRIITQHRRKVERLSARGRVPVRAQLEADGGLLTNHVDEAERFWNEAAEFLRIDPAWMRLDDRLYVELGSPLDNNMGDACEEFWWCFREVCEDRGLKDEVMPETLRGYLEWMVVHADPPRPAESATPG